MGNLFRANFTREAFYRKPHGTKIVFNDLPVWLPQQLPTVRNVKYHRSTNRLRLT